MKTFQRILAIALALIMSLSVLGTVAFADDDDTVTTTTATIDTSLKGSITIHKYEYNGDPGDNGTGSADDSVPSDATPLDAVTFKITKVADLTEYYGTDGKALPTVEAAKDMITTESYTTSGKTADGKVTFSELSLGLYLVQELDAPAQITGKTPDFLVSIPMTNADGDGWLYDVHVFPKNSSTYAGVTLLKQGRVGNGAVSVLEGATFVLQVKDADGEWNTVTANNKGVEIGTLTTGSDGKVSVSDLAPGEYRFVETAVGGGYIMDGAATTEFEINDAGKVLINGKETDTTQNPITVINDKPDMDKKVKDKNSVAQEAADYSVGDDVPYEITVEVPMNISKLTTFTLSDTLTNQKYNKDLSIAGLTKGTEYTITSETDTGYTVTFDTSKLTGGASLTVTYSAELLNTAVTTTAGNPNSAVLTYSNNIIPTTDDDNPNEGGTPSTNTITDQTVVYTFVLKVDKDDESGHPLADVEFDVYSYNGNEPKPTEAELKTNGTVVKHITTDENGLASVTGLENGTYYLVETKTAAGYNLLQAPVKVELNISYKTTWNETNTYDADGNLVKHEVSEKEEYFGGSATTVGANYVSQTIVNKKGFTLPQTGGIGTLMFIIIGGVLIAGGICLIAVPNKKRSV